MFWVASDDILNPSLIQDFHWEHPQFGGWGVGVLAFFMIAPFSYLSSFACYFFPPLVRFWLLWLCPNFFLNSALDSRLTLTVQSVRRICFNHCLVTIQSNIFYYLIIYIKMYQLRICFSCALQKQWKAVLCPMVIGICVIFPPYRKQLFSSDLQMQMGEHVGNVSPFFLSYRVSMEIKVSTALGPCSMSHDFGGKCVL